MYKFFRETNLISANLSGLNTGDSCTNKLLFITHEVYKSLDNYEITAAFPESLRHVITSESSL